MAKFILVTTIESSSDVNLNVDKIVFFKSEVSGRDGKTIIKYHSDKEHTLYVKQTPEEISALINAK